METTLKVVIVISKNWEGVYFNDVLVDGGRHLSLTHILLSATRKINNMVDELAKDNECFNGLVYILYEIDQCYINKLGRFPILFNKFDMNKLEEMGSVY